VSITVPTCVSGAGVLRAPASPASAASPSICQLIRTRFPSSSASSVISFIAPMGITMPAIVKGRFLSENGLDSLSALAAISCNRSLIFWGYLIPTSSSNCWAGVSVFPGAATGGRGKGASAIFNQLWKCMAPVRSSRMNLPRH
jgi:hypothetical protein